MFYIILRSAFKVISFPSFSDSLSSSQTQISHRVRSGYKIKSELTQFSLYFLRPLFGSLWSIFGCRFQGPFTLVVFMGITFMGLNYTPSYLVLKCNLAPSWSHSVHFIIDLLEVWIANSRFTWNSLYHFSWSTRSIDTPWSNPHCPHTSNTTHLSDHIWILF